MQQQKQRAETIRKRKGKSNNRIGAPLRLDSRKDKGKRAISNVNIKNDMKNEVNKYEKTVSRKTNNSIETKLSPQQLKKRQAKHEADKEQKSIKSRYLKKQHPFERQPHKMVKHSHNSSTVCRRIV